MQWRYLRFEASLQYMYAYLFPCSESNFELMSETSSLSSGGHSPNRSPLPSRKENMVADETGVLVRPCWWYCVYIPIHVHVQNCLTYMYCICVSLFALHVSLFALLCLHYLRFEPSQLGCLGSSAGRALD